MHVLLFIYRVLYHYRAIKHTSLLHMNMILCFYVRLLFKGNDVPETERLYFCVNVFNITSVWGWADGFISLTHSWFPLFVVLLLIFNFFLVWSFRLWMWRRRWHSRWFVRRWSGVGCVVLLRTFSSVFVRPSSRQDVSK